MYDHKPKQINTVQDMIDFIEPIPPSKWCVDQRSDGQGRHCVLGHLDMAYGSIAFTSEIVERVTRNWTNKLATINNGCSGNLWRSPQPEGTRTDGFAIRKRVLNYLKSLL